MVTDGAATWMVVAVICPGNGVAVTICCRLGLLIWARGFEFTKFTVEPGPNPVPVMVRGAPPSKVPVKPTTLVTVGTVGVQFQLLTLSVLPQYVTHCTWLGLLTPVGG